ncbi:hypothetical protein [Carboxylicivirga sp. M1479]|uniref:hypothetical protein n=1 Tax=Carboxylicivirga sp. M1479 TaxID=2594476 RepID=UPI0011776A42|nr:hypothetical protein [Carboxylicivirga sp. M1479]TRX71516.1 hypothetical protein FNN09_05975 [Carboxylicivirga sp. M1479]
MDNAAQVKHGREIIDNINQVERMVAPRIFTEEEKKLFKQVVKDLKENSILIKSHQQLIEKYVKLESNIKKLQTAVDGGDLKMVSQLNATIRLQTDVFTTLSLTPQKMITASKYLPKKEEDDDDNSIKSFLKNRASRLNAKD